MATRLYFHDAFYDRDSFNGIYHQGFLPVQVSNPVGAIFVPSSNVHVVGGYTSVTGNQLYTPLIASDPNYEADFDTLTLPLTGQTVYCVYYALNKYWVGTAAGAIYSSSDLKTWTTNYSGTLGINQILYANNTFVAVQQTGGIIVSTNSGVSWAAPTTTPGGTSNILCVAYSPTQNIWVAGLAGTGPVWSSTAPATLWTARTTPVSGQCYAAIWHANTSQFIIAGNAGKIVTSANGITWTGQTSGVTNSLWCLETDTASAANTVLVGGAAGTLLYSNNGTSWTRTTSFPNQALSIYAIWKGYNNAWMLANSGGIYVKSDNLVSTYTNLSTQAKIYSSMDATSYSNESSMRMRLMNTTIGTAQVSSNEITVASTTQQNTIVGIFASYPLNAPQTVGGGTLTLNTAANGSSAAAAYIVTGLNVYVWRPRTGLKVGTLVDSSNTSLGGTSGGTTEVSQNVTTATTAVSAQTGDIIVCELWSVHTQTMATAYTGRFFYDGTTVTTTSGTTVTNHASFLQLTENLTFRTTPRPRKSQAITY